MTYSKGQWDGVPDPEDPEATLAGHLKQQADTFRRLVGVELDDYMEEQVEKPVEAIQ